MTIEISADEVKRVGFSLKGPSHMTIDVVMTEGQTEKFLCDAWEYFGDEFFQKFFKAEGYTLSKDEE